VVALIVVAGPAVFFHLIESNPPARLALPPAVAGPNIIAPGPVSGTWAVTSGSQAGYRVQEILFGQHHTAVGRTARVSGGITISGTTVIAADFSVNMASVKSDQPSRDAQFVGYIMKTYDHPNGSFHLTRPVLLGRIPAPRSIVAATATGQLDLRGVSRSITFTLQAERVGGRLDVNAEIPISFSEWHIPNPSFAVTQVGPTGIIEVLLVLAPQQP
jgi:polyisoprenoid-binding protein YceI